MSILDMFRLDGKVALVTGAGSGLGRGIALSLAEAGADVAVAGRGHGLEETAELIRAAGRRALVCKVDLSSTAQMESLINDVTANLGELDILVNNAGMISRVGVLHATEADWDAVINLNQRSVFFLSQAAARRMAARGRGKIINTASLLAFQGGLGVPAYTASKHAVAGITRAMANELAPLGVNVNAIAPGYMATDMTTALQENPERSRQIGERIPAGRWGTPADLAGAVVYLASAASDYVHGHILAVDGGWLNR